MTGLEIFLSVLCFACNHRIENQRRNWFIANWKDIESLKDFVSVEYMEDDYETMDLFNSIINNMRSSLQDDEFVNEVLKLKTTTNFKKFVRTFIDLKSEENLGEKQDKHYTIIIKDIILEYLENLQSYKAIKVDKYFVDLKHYNKVTKNESGPEVGTLVVKPAKNDWTVYGLRNCPYSKYAVDLLKALDERYNNILVSDNEQSKSIVLKNLKKITEEDVPYDMKKIEKILKKGDPKLLEIQKRVKRMIKKSEPDSDSDEYEIDEQGNIKIISTKKAPSKKNTVINNSINEQLMKILFRDDSDDSDSDDENNEDENSDDENNEQEIDYEDVNSDDDVDQADNDYMSDMDYNIDDDNNYSPTNKQNQNEELPVPENEIKNYLRRFFSSMNIEDLSKLTLKQARNELETYFNVNFDKLSIKKIIQEVYDEYEEEEEEDDDDEKDDEEEEEDDDEEEEEDEEEDDLFFIETVEGIIQPLENYMRVIPEDWNTFPIIFLNERFIGGCDDLVKFIKNNILKMDFEGTVEELINYINDNREQFENKVTKVKLVDFEVFKSEGGIPLLIGDFKDVEKVEEVVHEQERCKYVYKEDYPSLSISKGDTCNKLADKTGYGYCKKHNPLYTDIPMGEIVKDTNITTQEEIITSTYIPRQLRVISKNLIKEKLKDEDYIDEDYIDEVEESIYNTLFYEVEFETDDVSEVRLKMIDNPVLTYLEKITDLTVYLGLKKTSTYFRTRFLKKYYSLDVIPKLTSKDKYYDLSLLNKQKRVKILHNITSSKINQKQNIVSRTLNLININNKLYKGQEVKLIKFDIDIKSIERPECYFEYENKENIYIYDGLCFDIKDLINKFSTNDFMYEKDGENKRFSDIFIEIVKNISLPQYGLQESIIKRDKMKERVERLRDKIFEKLNELEYFDLFEFSPMKSSRDISNKSSISSNRSSSSYKGGSVVSSKEFTDNNKDICYYCKKEVIDNKYKTFKKEGDEYIVVSFCSTECFEDSDEWNLSTTDDKDGTIDIVIEDRNDEDRDDEDRDDKTNTSKNSDSISIPTDIVSNKQKEMEEDLYNKLISD